jgi:hypothetical protein
MPRGGTAAAVQNDISLAILDCAWREDHSLPGSPQLWLWGYCPHWATAPSTAPPPQGGGSHLRHWSSGNITYHLPLPLAGYQSLRVSSLLSASALCSDANLFITAHCLLLSAQCPCVRLLKAFTCLFVKNNCYCSTSRSLLPDACNAILHNSRWLLFHPRAVTPLGSSPRTRVSASMHYACSHLCICAQGDQIHHTHEASRKSVTCHLPREANPVVVFDLIMITTAKSSRLLLHCCVQPLLRALIQSRLCASALSSLLSMPSALCFCSELSALYLFYLLCASALSSLLSASALASV